MSRVFFETDSSLPDIFVLLYSLVSQGTNRNISKEKVKRLGGLPLNSKGVFIRLYILEIP